MDLIPQNLKLDSKVIGALPIINHFMDRLNLPDLLEKYIPSKSNMGFRHSEAIALFIRNILVERQPLYNLSGWAGHYKSEWIGLGDSSSKILNDDRIGRSLNALFEADRATLMTEVVLKTIDEFKLDISQLHNDSTSVTVYGDYNGPDTFRGKPCIKLAKGHNKDHRPDLKQLVFTLTVSRDGAVPIHYKAYDGNVTDDTTHIQTWEALRRITGFSDFIYVADCKLCTKEQMEYIQKEGGLFITVLPESRSEYKWFRNWIQEAHPPWQEIYRTPNHRRPESKEEFIYYGFESPLPAQEGYRIIWILSSQKQTEEQGNRQKKIKKAIKALDELKSKIGKRNLRTKEEISQAVNAVLDESNAKKWFRWHLVTEDFTEYKQKGKGRPGRNTQYIQKVTSRYSFVAMPDEEAIRKDAMLDGIFPLITNISIKEIALNEVLIKYKYQPFVEKRHEQFKSVFDATPVLLKARHRVEALMFVYFIVLLLNGVIERELRLGMKKNKIPSLPLYPEDRLCKKPTTERILAFFQNQRRHILKCKGETVKSFNDPLTDLHKKVLYLMGISSAGYFK